MKAAMLSRSRGLMRRGSDEGHDVLSSHWRSMGRRAIAGSTDHASARREVAAAAVAAAFVAVAAASFARVVEGRGLLPFVLVAAAAAVAVVLMPV